MIASCKKMKWWYMGLVVCLTIFMMVTVGHAKETIKIGYIGPLKFPVGEECSLTVSIAVEEINAAGGVKLGGKMHKIEFIKVDSNEMHSLPDAVNAMERIITADKVDFIIGGYRSEAVLAMQEVVADHKVIWLNGYIGSPEPATRVVKDYNRYKYYFRFSNLNSIHQNKMGFNELLMVAETVRAKIGIKKPRVAILGEKVLWVDPVVNLALKSIPENGMEVAGVWRPSFFAEDVTAELTAIKNAGAHIIYFMSCGPVGAVVSKQWGELQIPAALIGLNCQAMTDRILETTGGLNNYEASLSCFGEADITPKTVPFIRKIKKVYGYTPTCCGTLYDAVYVLKDAIERAGTLDTDAMITALEKTNYLGVWGRIAFTPKDDPQFGHDIVFGPRNAINPVIQWIDGKASVVWPDGNAFLGTDKSWVGVRYKGSKDYQLPPWVIKYWKDKK
jgi:branched-chain amino acid transport system substrate-binding protein